MGDCSPAEFLWGPSRRGDHLVQLYSSREEFLNALEAWVAGGLQMGESVAVIATQPHRVQLELRLRKRLLEPLALQLDERLMLLDARDTLARFMRDGQPDRGLFDEFVDRLMERAGSDGRRVRAFGEMVVLLWREGNREAALNLEALWNDACERHGLALLCSYPQAVFGADDGDSIRHVCDAHTSLIIA
jgi:hypothetical protein